MSRVIIAGSRDFNDFVYLQGYLATIPPWLEITEVVSGGAPGADTLGEQWATLHNVPIKRFPAEWERLGKKAGPIRNAEMGIYAEGLIAFWNGTSKGTLHMINFMKEAGKWTYVIRTDIPWCGKFHEVDRSVQPFKKGMPILNNVEYTQEVLYKK